MEFSLEMHKLWRFYQLQLVMKKYIGSFHVSFHIVHIKHSATTVKRSIVKTISS